MIVRSAWTKFSQLSNVQANDLQQKCQRFCQFHSRTLVSLCDIILSIRKMFDNLSVCPRAVDDIPKSQLYWRHDLPELLAFEEIGTTWKYPIFLQNTVQTSCKPTSWRNNYILLNCFLFGSYSVVIGLSIHLSARCHSCFVITQYSF